MTAAAALPLNQSRPPEWRHEENVPAEQSQAQASSRIPCAHGDQGRATGVEVASRQGSRAALRLTPDTVTPGRFRRHQRLLTGADFARVFKEARRSSDRFFTVLARDNDLSFARLGLAVGKKQVRRAVGRNRIKRLVRERFRMNAKTLGTQDLVVVSRANAGASNEALTRSLAAHWARLRP